MPRQNPFSRKTATTYALLHRSQNDPLIHDESAPDRVLQAISGPSASSQSAEHLSSKVRNRGDLEAEFGFSSDVRENEGEAAEQGVYFDDTKYDYMQHMRDLGGDGSAGADVAWLEAPTQKQKGKGKERQTLEDALREVNLDGGARDDYDARSISGYSAVQSMASSRFGARRQTYQDQQEIPDAIAGFQPDMDPRLREVLEALDDEAYVDDEDDIFGELTGEDAEEVDEDEFERTWFDEEADEGWESDRTEKPMKEYSKTEAWIPAPGAEAHPDAPQTTSENLPDPGAAPPATAGTTDGDWLASFTKSKQTQSPLVALGTSQPSPDTRSVPRAPPSIAPSSVISSSTNNPFGRKKKRKGALTSTTSFSMTSSALARTEPLTTLDARFDRLAAEYMNDDEFDDDMIREEDEDDFDDNASAVTGITNKTGTSRISNMSKASMVSRWSTASGASQVPQLVPAQFDKVLDDFLGGSEVGKKGRKMRKGGKAGVWVQESGMDQLDEIRKGLGPARLKT